MNEVAALLGISVNSAKSYLHKGMLPEPDAMIGTHRGWLPKTITDWNYNRPRPRRRELDPAVLKSRRAAVASPALSAPVDDAIAGEGSRGFEDPGTAIASTSGTVAPAAEAPSRARSGGRSAARRTRQ
ncbi:hypothetical protein ACLILY_30680 [Mycobacterium sp. MS3]|uniref:hypothetical protein n=1 Tax=Mycobacterium sp. MS3 TaxID=3391378 RepID=UPI0039894808